MDNNNNKNDEVNEVSILRLLKVCFHRYFLLAGVTAATLVVGTAGLTFVGKRKEAYNAKFTYSIPSIVDGKYLDGSAFEYPDILSRENLKNVIESKEEYKNIKLEKIIKSDFTNIEMENVYDEATKALIETNYSVILPKSVFSSNDQAKSFFNDLISYPINKTKDAYKSLNYKINFDDYDNSKTYENQIEALSQQYYFLIDAYNNLKSLYGDASYNDKTISKYNNDIKNLHLEDELTIIKNEVKQKGYLKNPSKDKENLAVQKKAIEKDIEINTQKIKELKEMVKFLMENNSSTASQDLNIDAYNQKISDLIVNNVDLNYKIKEIDKKITEGEIAPTEFITKLDTFKNQLVEKTNEYVTVEGALIDENSKITYKSKKIITEVNHSSLIKNGLISLVAGLVLGCVINLIVDRKYIYEDYPAKEKKGN